MVATFVLFASIFGWMISTSGAAPVWLWFVALGVGFVTAVLFHIHNAAHDSLPED